MTPTEGGARQKLRSGHDASNNAMPNRQFAIRMPTWSGKSVMPYGPIILDGKAG